MKRASQRTRTQATEAARRQQAPESTEQEEHILQEATKYLVLKHGHLLVATGIAEERTASSRSWILTVTLRYPTGHEGYIGDLRYDGKEFRFLTPAEVRKERARAIAEDPEGIRQWHEYRDSTLPPGEA